jgi:methylamine utilization protein MauE
VREALTGPFAVAALVVIVAGVAKLRSPKPAARALEEIGWNAGQTFTRSIAFIELALGGWCVAQPSRANAVALAVLYGVFGVVSARLVRRRAACGCFGERETPAWAGQVALSLALAAVGAAAALQTPGTALEHPVLIVGIGGAAYATVLAYTALPAAWTAWSGR